MSLYSFFQIITTPNISFVVRTFEDVNIVHKQIPLLLVLADCISPKPSYSEAKAEAVRFELT